MPIGTKTSNEIESFSNPCIFATLTQCSRPVIFQTLIYVQPNNLKIKGLNNQVAKIQE